MSDRNKKWAAVHLIAIIGVGLFVALSNDTLIVIKFSAAVMVGVVLYCYFLLKSEKAK